jgi:hypothetical protein
MTAPALQPDDDGRVATEAALRRLQPAADSATIAEQLLWLKNTTREGQTAIVALDPEVDEINRLLDASQLLLERFARPLDRRRPLATPGRDAWRDLRQALRNVASLPEDPTVLAKALRQAPRRTHARIPGRGHGQVQHAVANTCAGIYYVATGHMPPVQSVDGLWGELVRAVFDWQHQSGTTCCPRAAKAPDPNVGSKSPELGYS